jgi:hypothetical protein
VSDCNYNVHAISVFNFADTDVSYGSVIGYVWASAAAYCQSHGSFTVTDFSSTSDVLVDQITMANNGNLHQAVQFNNQAEKAT